ncbi:MAG: hypothetical protein OEU25_22625 [Rhodospirillales bacterium]|jgi:hypothetical protein|nr:hypothetical protein [Rhodospirillales bacterium]
MTRKLWIVSAATIVCSGLNVGTALAADQAAYDAACKAAESARQSAAEMRYEWNTIKPLIEKAGVAAQAGDYERAVKLCDEARKHGEEAIAQAKHESEAWKLSAVR